MTRKRLVLMIVGHVTHDTFMIKNLTFVNQVYWIATVTEA